MRRRLPVSAEPGCVLGGKRRQFANCSGLPGQDGVVNQSSRIRVVPPESLEQLKVEGAGTIGSYRGCNGKPRELVPEADRVAIYLKQAKSAGLIDCRLA